MPKNATKSKIAREDLIVICVFAVFGIGIPAAIIARHFYGIDPIALLHLKWGRTVMGFIFFVLATPVCLSNCYISIIDPWRYQKKHGSMKDYAHSSGLPMVGSVFVFIAGVLLPPSIYSGIFLITLYVIDGNGLPWFFVSILRDGT